MSKKTSLRQFLMQAGIFERAGDCINAIRSGKAAIDNAIELNPNHFFNPKKSLVTLDGKKIKKAEKAYFLFNKPSGCICQKSDKEKNIYSLIKEIGIDDNLALSLSAVGRLDRDTEGLMILTNDGSLSQLILDPKNRIEKEYLAVLELPLSKSDARKIKSGVEIEVEGNAYKAKALRIEFSGQNKVHVSITEGKKRQVRKMFEAVGNKVSHLKRVSIGNLKLGDLKTKEIRKINKEELLEKIGIK